MSASTVIVTREEDPRDGRLGAALRAAGLEPRHVPLIASRRMPPDEGAMTEALAALRAGAWLAFTSRRAVDFWLEEVGERGLPSLSTNPNGLIFAVGEGTADAVRAAGRNVDGMPESSRGSELANVMLEFAARQSPPPVIVFPRAVEIASDWPSRIESAGIRVVSPVIYETSMVEADLRPIISAAASGQIGAISFASPSAVDSFSKNLCRANLDWGGGCLLAAIGPATAAALARQHLAPAWECPSSRFTDFAANLAQIIKR